MTLKIQSEPCDDSEHDLHTVLAFSLFFPVLTNCDMERRFEAGDDLVFQLESGYGLLRVLGVSGDDSDPVWHLSAYQELFPDVDAAEAALTRPLELHPAIPHMALSSRAFERTPAAKIGQRPLSVQEGSLVRKWSEQKSKEVSDRSVLLMLGLR